MVLGHASIGPRRVVLNCCVGPPGDARDAQSLRGLRTKRGRVVAAATAVLALLSIVSCGPRAYSPLSEKTFATAIAEASKSAKSVHMTVEESSKLHIDADFSYRKPTAMTMTMTMALKNATSTISIRLVGKSIYLQLPPATPAGKWVKADAAQLGAGTAESYDRLGPEGLADQFKDGIKRIEYVRATKIGGETVHHYTVVEDASRLGSSLKALASHLPSLAKVKTVDEEVYLGADNRLRRMTITLPAPIGTMQIDFTGWNVPVAIEAPSAADVVTGGS